MNSPCKLLGGLLKFFYPAQLPGKSFVLLVRLCLISLRLLPCERKLIAKFGFNLPLGEANYEVVKLLLLLKHGHETIIASPVRQSIVRGVRRAARECRARVYPRFRFCQTTPTFQPTLGPSFRNDSRSTSSAPEGHLCAASGLPVNDVERVEIPPGRGFFSRISSEPNRGTAGERATRMPLMPELRAASGSCRYGNARNAEIACHPIDCGILAQDLGIQPKGLGD